MFNIKISVIITAYNRKNFLMDAIQSVLSQNISRNYYEVILIRNFEDPILDKICNENSIRNIVRDGSIGEYLKFGIQESTGDLISFLDDDDLFCPDKLNTILNLYGKEKFDFLHNNYEEIDEEGNYRRPYLKKLHFTSYDFEKITYEIEFPVSRVVNLMRKDADFNISCMTISSGLAKKIADMLDKVTACQDGFFFFSAINYGIVTAVGAKLTKYRVHESTSTNLSNLRKFSDNVCYDTNRQIKSLLILYDYYLNRKVSVLLDEFIAVKKLKVMIFCQGYDGIDIVSAFKTLKSSARANAYACIWLSLYLLSRVFRSSVRLGIFKFIKNTKGN